MTLGHVPFAVALLMEAVEPSEAELFSNRERERITISNRERENK